LTRIKVRKNACTRARGSPARRKSVFAQREDYNEGKGGVHYTMRCIVFTQGYFITQSITYPNVFNNDIYTRT